MDTALYEEYKVLCFQHNLVPAAGVKFERIGGDAELLSLIIAMRDAHATSVSTPLAP